MDNATIGQQWTEALRHFDTEEREEIRKWVHTKTGLGFRTLQRHLLQAHIKWIKLSDIERENDLRALEASKGREIITWNPAHHEAILPEILTALKQHLKDPKILSHGQGPASIRPIVPQTVRMVLRYQKANLEEYPPMMGIAHYDQVSMRLRAMEAIRFVKRNDSGLKPIEAPKNMLDSILASHNAFPPLTGIVEHPLVLKDGRLLAQRGYDYETGLFYHFTSHIVPKIPEIIPQARAEAALRYLEEVFFAEFPFRSQADLSGAIATLLTTAQRHFIGGPEGCPGFVITAPTQATGKTALARIISLVLLDRPIPAASWSSDDDEMAKRILAILMEGHNLVVFDNLQEGTKITGNELAKAMTGETYTSRLLGHNKWITVPACCTWVFTGNNICPSGDYNTRLLTLCMDSQDEHPDRRTFTRTDLSEWCRAHRHKILEELFILLAGGYRAAANGDVLPFKPTRFPEWDQMVRLPMLWAGAEDPATLFEQNKAEDPMMEGRSNFLAAWYERYGSTPVTMRSVVDSMSAFNGDHLDTAIYDILPKGTVTSLTLSGFARRIKGRVIDGMMIHSVKSETCHKGSLILWQVIRT